MGRMFRCVGLGSRVGLVGQSLVGGRGGNTAWRQVSHLPVSWNLKSF